MPDQADTPNLPVSLGGGGEKKTGAGRRGRPKGARNKASKAQSDILAYIKAKNGTTPGQQAVDLWLVSPRDIAQAKKWAKAGGLVWSVPRGAPIPEMSLFTPQELGFKFKVYKMQALYGLTAKEAMTFLYNAGSDLTGYTNNKQSAIEAPEDPNADRADIIGVAVDGEFLAQVPENAEFNFDVEDLLTPDSSQ